MAAYAAQRAVERQLVVRVQEPVRDIKTTGRAGILQSNLTSKCATVSVSHTVDIQDSRVNELAVQYSA
ncbi:hypothetical protein [Hymenobacter arizonensis]|uniref:Uncharacterized protein n=1 Tax=Hymenobacter arizonensis TaxID=1227077 RepID=A0A1I6BRX3_HYMAR|nr:hypothetical protein [Hymenobacter arizonensis]SFQ83675.1 hypothetical protein SAMN04515668_5025 [Hymenobacter arizonensis]